MNTAGQSATGWASIVQGAATVVLVLITAYYAYQNRLMAKAMATSHEDQVRPRLVPNLRVEGPVMGYLQVVNVGTGPARGVDIRLRLEPSGWERRWRSSLVLPGEVNEYLIREEKRFPSLDQVATENTHFVIAGECYDVDGRRRVVEERMELRETWQALQASDQLLHQEREEQKVDALKEIARALENARSRGLWS